MQPITVIAAVLVLVLLTESLIEYFTEGVVLPAWAKKVAAAVVGVALALLYDVDLITQLVGTAPILPYVGPVLTGLILGRGANYVHDVAGFGARAHSGVTGGVWHAR
ncbi:MAG TPA: hypothetical protein VHL09_17115 [Dehalococcoidia bacterium]|nr:hypothetical protein [Dehalococcoidia bacterium]